MALPELSGFAFDRVIGRGGTATVYLAVQAPFDRQVAVKIYQGQITEDQSRRVFEKECRAIGQLSARQGFAAFYAAGFMDDGAPYLVMQYYPKGSLAGLVRTSGPLSTDEVIGVVRRIGGALVASHAAGIYHRDVKPENMLIDDEGLPVLSDFGISAIGDAASSRSVMAFSPSHVAPEVLEGARAGASADLYSFASSLFTLLEGHAPFEKSDDGHPGAMLVRVLQQEPPLITRTDVPPGLVALISRTLAKSPQDRPRDVAAFLDEFELAIGSDRTSDDHRSDLKRSSEEGGSSEQAEKLDRQDDESVDALIGDETVLRSSLGRPNQVPPEVPTQGVPQDARESVGDVVAVATASEGPDQTVLRSNRSGGTVETAAPRPTASRSVDKPLEARPKWSPRYVLILGGVAIAFAVVAVALIFKPGSKSSTWSTARTTPAPSTTTTTVPPTSIIQAAAIPAASLSPAGTFGSTPTFAYPGDPPPSQLEVADLIIGSGQPAASGDSVTVTCWAADYLAKATDLSPSTSSAAIVFLPSGSINVLDGGGIPGLGQGLLGIRPGARRELIIPPDQQGYATGIVAQLGDALMYICDRTS